MVFITLHSSHAFHDTTNANYNASQASSDSTLTDKKRILNRLLNTNLKVKRSSERNTKEHEQMLHIWPGAGIRCCSCWFMRKTLSLDVSLSFFSSLLMRALRTLTRER